jgi:hypothetical protein
MPLAVRLNGELGGAVNEGTAATDRGPTQGESGQARTKSHPAGLRSAQALPDQRRGAWADSR